MAICRRSKNKWQVRIFLGRDSSGKRTFHTKTITGLKRDAERYENEYKYTLNVNNSNMQSCTFDDLVNIYKADYCFAALSEKTQRNYLKHLKTASAVIGKLKISEIRPITISQLMKQLPPQIASVNTAALFFRVLKVIFNYAARMELIEKNPMNSLTAPKKERKEFQFLEEDEIKRFLKVCKGDNNYAVLAFALLSGARPEEYTALTWDKVNFKTNTVKIEQTSCFGKIRVNIAKTDKSLREIDMPPAFMKNLLKLQKRQKADAVLNPLNLVFPSVQGKILTCDALRKRLAVLLAKAGISKKLRVYDLRHTHATFLMSRIGDPKAVADRLGHANASMTLNVYCHTSKNSINKIIDSLEAL